MEFLKITEQAVLLTVTALCNLYNIVETKFAALKTLGLELGPAIPAIPILGLRQEDLKVKACLGYRVR